MTSLTLEHDFEGEGIIDGAIAVAIRSGTCSTIATCCCRGSLQVVEASILAVSKVPSFACTLIVRDVEAVTAPTHAIFGRLLHRVN